MGTNIKQAEMAQGEGSLFHAISLPFREEEEERIWTERTKWGGGVKEFQGGALMNARGQFRLERLPGALEPPVAVRPSVIGDPRPLRPGRP